MECLHEALQEKRSDKKNPGFECENEIQSSDTVENLITGLRLIQLFVSSPASSPESGLLSDWL